MKAPRKVQSPAPARVQGFKQSGQHSSATGSEDTFGPLDSTSAVYTDRTHVSRRLQTLVEQLPQNDIEAIVCALLDCRNRRRVANAYIGGWIPAAEAMDLLIDCGLIEFDADLLEKARRHG